MAKPPGFLSPEKTDAVKTLPSAICYLSKSTVMNEDIWISVD